MNQVSQFGVNVWWTLPETSVDGALVQQLLVKHGFEAEDMKMPSERIEVSRAAYSFQNRRGKENRRVTEKAKCDANSVVYGILDRQQDGEEISFAQHTTVRYDKVTGNVSVAGSLAEDYNKVLEEFRGKITDADIRYFLRNVIRMCFGIAKRPTGGIYFVPDKFSGIIEQAKEMLAEINSGARIYVERVMDGAQERKNVWDSVEAEVEANLTKVISDVENLSRVSAIRGRKADIEATEELMQVYQQLLGEEAKYEGLAERIEEAVKVVTAKLDAFAVAKPEKEPTLTAIDVAVKILTKEGKSMSHREILDKAIAEGLFDTKAANPYVSFNGTLMQSIKSGDNRIEKIGRGVYGLHANAA